MFTLKEAINVINTGLASEEEALAEALREGDLSDTAEAAMKGFIQGVITCLMILTNVRETDEDS